MIQRSKSFVQRLASTIELARELTLESSKRAAVEGERLSELKQSFHDKLGTAGYAASSRCSSTSLPATSDSAQLAHPPASLDAVLEREDVVGGSVPRGLGSDAPSPSRLSRLASWLLAELRSAASFAWTPTHQYSVFEEDSFRRGSLQGADVRPRERALRAATFYHFYDRYCLWLAQWTVSSFVFGTCCAWASVMILLWN